MSEARRGKAALFSHGPASVDGDDAPPDRPAAAGPGRGRAGDRSGGAPSGRQQMFSGAGGLAWTVSCRSCRAETPVSGSDLVRRLLRPGSLWWPLARHANRMPCPACGDTTWCQVRWRARTARHPGGSS